MSSINIMINKLNDASSITVLVLSLISITSGGIGFIFNFLVFGRASMRREPCAVYFFWSTCFSLIYVLIIQPVRLLAVSFSLDQANYNLGICKIEFFTFYVTRSVSSWLVVLACIDRYFHSSTNARIRRMSSLKTAKMSIGITSIIIFIVHIHILVYYELSYSSNQNGTLTSSCPGQNITYRTFIGFWNLVLYSFCPSVLMLFFGLLTLKNVRKHRLVIPVGIETNRISRRTDTQLFRMLIVQVLVIFICTLPISIYQLYAGFTKSISKDTLRIAQENLGRQIASVMTYYAHSSTFYLYTLVGTTFRKELFKIIRQCLCPSRNAVAMTKFQAHTMSVLHETQRNIPTHISL